MSRNNRNRNNRNRQIRQTETQPVALQEASQISNEEVDVNNDSSQSPQTEVVGDTVTGTVPTPPETPVSEVAETVASAPVAEPVVEPTPVVQEVVESNDSPSVVKLKLILNDLKDALNGYGKKPEDFAPAAKLAAALTKHVTSNPKKDVLDALLDFFVENKDGVCKPTEFMKGSTTLSSTEEQKVGYLYNLFLQIVNKRYVRINATSVINVLGRPEIAEYFKKKMNVLRQNS